MPHPFLIHSQKSPGSPVRCGLPLNEIFLSSRTVTSVTCKPCLALITLKPPRTQKPTGRWFMPYV